MPNHVVLLNDKVANTILGSTRETCVSTCEDDLDCISVDFYKPTSICYHNVDSAVHPIPEINYDYYYICDRRRSSPGESRSRSRFRWVIRTPHRSIDIVIPCGNPGCRVEPAAPTLIHKNHCWLLGVGGYLS